MLYDGLGGGMGRDDYNRGDGGGLALFLMVIVTLAFFVLVGFL